MILTNIKNSKNEKDRGFTIVELLIVIIVIGILATLVLVAYNNIQGQARDTKRQAAANAIGDASETYKTASTAGTYPRTDTGANFQTDIGTASNYQNGAKAVSVDTTISGNLGTTPSSTAKDGIGILYCLNGASSTNTAASGIKISYYSEASAGVKYVTTGIGAGTTSGSACAT